jgi:hypothetical protein
MPSKKSNANNRRTANPVKQSANAFSVLQEGNNKRTTAAKKPAPAPMKLAGAWGRPLTFATPDDKPAIGLATPVKPAQERLLTPGAPVPNRKRTFLAWEHDDWKSVDADDDF